MDDCEAHTSLPEQTGQVTPPGAVHLIHHHHFVGKVAPNAIEIDRDAGVSIAVILDPFGVIVQGVKALHEPARAGILNIDLTAGVVDQLEFIDTEGNKIGYVGWRGITQAGVELDALPLRRVVAGGSDDQPRHFVLWQHLGLVESQGWGGHVARANVHLEAVGKAGFRSPLRNHVRIAAGVMPEYDHLARKILSADEGRHVFIVQKVAYCLHNLAGTGFGKIKAPASPNARSAKTEVLTVINLPQQTLLSG